MRRGRRARGEASRSLRACVVAAWAPALLALLACSADDPQLRLVVDVPDSSLPAYPYTELDGMELSVAHAGATGSLALRSVARGEDVVLPSVPFADDLVVHLSGTRGGVEVAYGRTCVFGVARGALPPPQHLFFSRIVKWAPGPRPLEPGRIGASAYTTPDGSAVFVGGDAGETAVERFDPASARFLAAGDSAARTGAIVAALPDGRALRIGGVAGGEGVGFYELLTPEQGRVEALADDRLRLVGHAAVTLVDGSVVVIGGRVPGGAISGATYTLGATAAPRLLAAQLAVPREDHTLTRLGDAVGAAVLVTGGRDGAGQPVAEAELYEPLREGYAAFHPAMVRPRWDHQAVPLPDGSVLIVGGRDAAGPVDTVEVYAPNLAQFVDAGRMPARAGLTELSATPLPDGRVLLAGGRDASGAAVALTFIARLDPIGGTVDFSQTDSLATPRAGHAAARLCDGTMLVVGGTTDPAAPPSERYDPPSAGRR